MANVGGPTICQTCGKSLPAQQGRGRQRQFCDATCRSAARRERAKAAVARLPHVNLDLTAEVRKGSLDTVVNDAASPDRVVADVLDAARQFAEAWPRQAAGSLAAVSAVRQLAGAVDEALRATVDRARDSGHTWQEVGDVLGTTRQAAFQRFG